MLLAVVLGFGANARPHPRGDVAVKQPKDPIFVLLWKLLREGNDLVADLIIPATATETNKVSAFRRRPSISPEDDAGTQDLPKFM